MNETNSNQKSNINEYRCKSYYKLFLKILLRNVLHYVTSLKSGLDNIMVFTIYFVVHTYYTVVVSVKMDAQIAK